MISGSLPLNIGNMSSLTQLIAGENRIEGPLPISLHKLHRLRILDIHANQLTGEVSNSIFSTLPMLTILHLEDNQLSGAIPVSLGELTKVHTSHNIKLCVYNSIFVC